VNAVEEITATAIPPAFALIAAFVADTISGTDEFCDPVHAGLGNPTSAAASAIPYCVGTKNGLVVTWFTNVNFHAGVDGKSPAACCADAPPVLDDEHAASNADAAPAADTKPAPDSNLRRDGPSLIPRVSIASSTFGSTSLI